MGPTVLSQKKWERLCWGGRGRGSGGRGPEGQASGGRQGFGGKTSVFLTCHLCTFSWTMSVLKEILCRGGRACGWSWLLWRTKGAGGRRGHQYEILRLVRGFAFIERVAFFFVKIPVSQPLLHLLHERGIYFATLLISWMFQILERVLKLIVWVGKVGRPAIVAFPSTPATLTFVNHHWVDWRFSWSW